MSGGRSLYKHMMLHHSSPRAVWWMDTAAAAAERGHEAGPRHIGCSCEWLRTRVQVNTRAMLVDVLSAVARTVGCCFSALIYPSTRATFTVHLSVANYQRTAEHNHSDQAEDMPPFATNSQRGHSTLQYCSMMHLSTNAPESWQPSWIHHKLIHNHSCSRAHCDSTHRYRVLCRRQARVADTAHPLIPHQPRVTVNLLINLVLSSYLQSILSTVFPNRLPVWPHPFLSSLAMSAIIEAVKSSVASAFSSNPDPTDAGPRPPFIIQNHQQWPGSEADMHPKPDFGEETYKGTGKLKDHVALITGGDSGIGRAVALAYAREGADVAISYLNEHDDAKETERVVKAAGRRCILLPGDLADEAQCKKIVADTVKEFGHIDILVNNAAMQGNAISSITDIDRQRLEYTFMVNIVAMFTITSAALPHIREGGAIINTGSIEAYKPDYFILDYAVTKAAIVGFTKGLAGELVPKGIRVNCVAPGPVWTPLIPSSFSKPMIATFGANFPIGRPAQPAELATSYVFLASQESRYVNAEVLSVTGGMPTY